MTPKSDTMTFPMTAIGNVSIGKRQYKSGEVFDAENIDIVNELKMRNAAHVGDTTLETAVAAGQTTDVAKTNVATPAFAETPSNTVVPSIAEGAKGTSNGYENSTAGEGRTGGRRTSVRGGPQS